MVQPPENRTELRGRVVHVGNVDDSSAFVQIDVDVQDAQDVAGYANLLAWSPGKTVSINIPREQASKLSAAEGRQLECSVTKTGPQQVLASGESVRVT